MFESSAPRRLFLCSCTLTLIISVTCLSDSSLGVIEEKEEIVSRLAARASLSYQRRSTAVLDCTCSLHSCSYEFPGAQCEEALGGLDELCGEQCPGQLIDYNQSIVRLPPETDPRAMSPSLKESICTYRDLDTLFPDFPRDLAWTYLGTTDGHFRRWPASGRTRAANGEPLLGNCRSYDPRTRPWYIDASAGPKDIVFVIDQSGSMDNPSNGGGAPKWTMTVAAVSALVDTLSTSDYFNIITFSDSARQLWQQNSLAQGIERNKVEIKEILAGHNPDGGTSFEPAFELAFDLLTDACGVERKTCSGCEKVIIFLTDGRDTSGTRGGGIKASVMNARIAEYQKRLEEQTSRRASIFTFSLGKDADDSIPRQIACNNDGSWSFIKDDDDPLTAMRSFYLFLTARRTSGTPIWTEPYMDDSGLGEIITVAKPVFSQGSGSVKGVFLGVAGHDVLFSELDQSQYELDDILDELLQRTGRCEPVINDTCQLQVLRNVYANEATCIDPFPIDADSSRDRETPRCFTNGKSYYKRFSDLVKWDDAKNRCEEDGGILVSIGGGEELQFVSNMASEDGTWVGARRNFDTFTWQEGSTPDLDNDSPFWGIGQPNSYQGVQDCVCMDTRGPSANLDDVQCDNKLTFICEYDTDRSCDGEALNPRDQPNEYFTIPPLDSCVNSEASVAKARTVSTARNLVDEEILCPLGQPRTDAEVKCCPDCLGTVFSEPNEDPEIGDGVTEDVDPLANDVGLSSALAIAITSIAFVVVVGSCTTFVFVYRRRQQTVEPGTTDQRAETSVDVSITTYTSQTPSHITESQI